MAIEQKVVFSREQLDAYFASYVGMEGEILQRQSGFAIVPHIRGVMFWRRPYIRVRNPLPGTTISGTSIATAWRAGSRISGSQGL
ncbi:hypothetical protein [Cupriavidus sp. D39]|uniref:hypothetical protein n=1 Tax=Cupriavidus sp. D39 TaxID=2997877 RepID=UPI00226ED03F|nr:hypothetical protein [Cupriavidus sp. D39]MCY0853532.1 hypothetical protein [Cupriavidus sp. D39]